MQLLVDNEILSDFHQVRRVMGQVRKHPANPVLQADRPWERHAASGGGLQVASALYDSADGLFKLWYNILQPQAFGGSGVAYATSRNGVEWSKPNLGLVEFGGEKDNNLCRLEPFGTLVRGLQIIRDSRPRPEAQCYLGIGVWPRHEDGTWYGGWLGVAQSSDGKIWHYRGGGVRQGSGGGNPACLWDESLGRYLLFHRQLTEIALPEKRKRYIVRQESSDLQNWSPRRTVFNPLNPTWPEVESMNVFAYEGLFIGLANMLETEQRGEMEIHLVVSRDGYRWEEPFPDQAFIPRGPRGDFDDMLVYWAQPILHGDRIYFYYTGARYSHGYPREPIVDDGMSLTMLPHQKGRYEPRPNRIGLATLTRDRFAGLRADEPVGAFLTRPLLIDGDMLYVNADVDRELRVEVVSPVTQIFDAGPKEDWAGHYISAREEVFPGFSRADCEVVTGDGVALPVRWKGGTIGKFKGRAVRLRFLGRMATVYAFGIKE